MTCDLVAPADKCTQRTFPQGTLDDGRLLGRGVDGGKKGAVIPTGVASFPSCDRVVSEKLVNVSIKLGPFV